MPITIDNQVPFDVDVANPDQLKQFVISLKKVLAEVCEKAQQMQIEVRTDAPGTSDLGEGEFVRATVGGLSYIYTKKDGQILRWQIS